MLLSTLFSLFLSSAHAAETHEPATCATRFVFAGQPSCLSLDWVDGKTRAENSCEHAILLDRSVKADAMPLFPGTTAWLTDLNSFTLGMDGQLYRAVALFDDTCDSDVAPSRQIADASTPAK